MITLTGNTGITAQILDPRIDADKLGSRYCSGGYVWQVYDERGRPLLSGPHYPKSDPPVFDGQGMPEAFTSLLGCDDDKNFSADDDVQVGENVCVIGVGLVKKTSDIKPFHARNNPHVVKPCVWDVELYGDDRVVMTTRQEFISRSMSYKIKLVRDVRVTNNGVESITTLENQGETSINIDWFAHPFFPVNVDHTCGKILPSDNAPIIINTNDGYDIDDCGTIRMKKNYPWERGLFIELNAPQSILNFDIAHHVINNIYFTTDYPASRLALWANANTFSFEPFLHRTIAAQKSTSWKVALAITI